MTSGHITCKGPLLAEVEKAHGAADPSAIIPYLDDGDLDGTDSSNRPLLIVAARQGHAKIVSILITAGAKSTVTDPSFHNVNAAIHAATPLTDPGPSLRAARASVLYHFGAALDVVGDASFDWSYEDDNNNTVLDVLRLAEDRDPRPAGEDADILYQMADYVAAKGGTCNNAPSDRRICGSGPVGQALQNKVCVRLHRRRGSADQWNLRPLSRRASFTGRRPLLQRRRRGIPRRRNLRRLPHRSNKHPEQRLHLPPTRC